VPFFGHLAPIPAGPALLAIEADVPVYVGSVRRTRDLRYSARVVLVPTPETGTRREKVTAITAGIAAEFERVLADGPEQWWGGFHPIWPDLAVGSAETTGAGDERAADTGAADTGAADPATPADAGTPADEEPA
jgi:predicted LPLAT superfamily acyltransferase